jgi:hypothetical protein
MMETRRLLVVMAALVLLLLGLRACLRPDPRERALEFCPDMVRSPAARSQGASTVLPLGMVQQPLVPGVVLHGSEDFDYERGPEEAKRAGSELESPLAGSPTEERDARLFARFCSHCHGLDGEGRGRVVERGMNPPPSFRAARAMSIKDGEAFHIITMGQNTMAAHGAQIPPLDRWRIIRHLRSLQGATK